MRNPISDFTRAKRKYQEVQRLLDENPNAATELIRCLVPPGIYVHFKSTPAQPKRYLVVGPQQDVDTDFWSVSYMALYAPHFGVLTSRPLLSPANGFLTPINRRKYRGKRFRLEEKFELKDLFQQMERFQ